MKLPFIIITLLVASSSFAERTNEIRVSETCQRGLVGVGIKSWSAVLCCTTQDWFIITFGTALSISISLNILREFLPLLVFSFLPLRLHSDSRWSRQAIFVWPVPPSYLHWRGRSARGKWDSWDLAIDARLQRWYSNIGRTTWSCQRKWKKPFCHWCSDV